MQRLAGDAAGARVTAQQARNTLSSSAKTNQTMSYLAMSLSQVYAVMGEKDLALKASGAAIMLGRAKDPLRTRIDTRASGNNSDDGRRE